MVDCLCCLGIYEAVGITRHYPYQGMLSLVARLHDTLSCPYLA